MEFLASLAIKAFIGTSICGAVTVGTIYKCDKTLLGFKDNVQNPSETSGQVGGDTKTGTGNTTNGTVSVPATPEVSDNTATKGISVETGENNKKNVGVDSINTELIKNKSTDDNAESDVKATIDPDNQESAEKKDEDKTKITIEDGEGKPTTTLTDGAGVEITEEPKINKVSDSQVTVLPGSSSQETKPIIILETSGVKPETSVTQDESLQPNQSVETQVLSATSPSLPA